MAQNDAQGLHIHALLHGSTRECMTKGMKGKVAEDGKKVIMVRIETSPEDLAGMSAAEGILTARGGMTSHAAVVARGMGTCCVSGCGDINMHEENKKFTLAGQTFTEGSEISIDGTTGNIYAGIIPTKDAEIAGEFGRVMAWARYIFHSKCSAKAYIPWPRQCVDGLRGPA